MPWMLPIYIVGTGCIAGLVFFSDLPSLRDKLVFGALVACATLALIPGGDTLGHFLFLFPVLAFILFLLMDTSHTLPDKILLSLPGIVSIAYFLPHTFVAHLPTYAIFPLVIPTIVTGIAGWNLRKYKPVFAPLAAIQGVCLAEFLVQIFTNFG